MKLKIKLTDRRCWKDVYLDDHKIGTIETRSGVMFKVTLHKFDGSLALQKTLIRYADAKNLIKRATAIFTEA